METAGLAIGVAGLTALFSSCVQCWGYISAGRAFAQDFAIQHMKLDIEKTLFLQWGLRIGILDAEDEGEAVLDPRISLAGDVQTAVFDVLLALKKLLTDSDVLCLKYGIVVEDRQPEDEPESNGQERLSHRQMRAFKSWQDRIRARQRDTSVWRKTRWACRDRDKFLAFINEINYFNSKLQSLAPATRFVHDLAIHQAMAALRSDVAALRLVRDASANWHTDWSDAASEQIRETEPGSGTVRSAGDGPDGFEFVQEWQANVSHTEPPPPKARLVAVEENWLRVIQRQANMCSGLPNVLQGCFHAYYRNLGKSDVCHAVKTKLDIHRLRLKGLEFTPSGYEVLKAGLAGWHEQCLNVEKLANSKERDKGGLWKNIFDGNLGEWDVRADIGKRELEAAILALDTSLDFVINSAK